MAKFRHRIIDITGDAVTGGVSTLEPPPSIVQLVKDNKSADAEWKKWLNNFYGYVGTLTQEMNQQFITPDSFTVNAGGTPVGTISDATTLNDGNALQVPEVAATPGFDIDFDFSGISSISGFVSHIWYDGGTVGHEVSLDLYDYTAAGRDEFLQINASSSIYGYRTVLIPDDTDYISSGNAQMTLYHHSAGNAAHDIYIDYIAIIGRLA